MFEYNIVQNEWKERDTPMTQKRESHACFMINDVELMVIGGHDGTHTLKSSSIFHLKKKTWKQGPSLPTATSLGQFVKSKLQSQYLGYLMGGYSPKVSLNPTLSSIYALKKDLTAFEKIGNLKEQRSGHDAFLSQDAIIERCYN